MGTAAVNGVALYYEVRGDGAPVLGVHGTPSTSAVWSEAAETLAKHGRCITYDRRGFHRSTPVGPDAVLDLADHVADAAALLAALDAAPALVIGRSTGGLIALQLARQHPEAVRALVLLEPAVFTADPLARVWAQDLRELIWRAAEPDPSSAAEAVMVEALGRETWESWPDELRELFSAAAPAVLAEMRGSGLDLSADPLALDEATLAGIEQPTLLVSASDSPEPLRLVNRRLAAAMPNAESVLVPGGHLIDPAHEVVLDFVDRYADAS